LQGSLLNANDDDYENDKDKLGALSLAIKWPMMMPMMMIRIVEGFFLWLLNGHEDDYDNENYNCRVLSLKLNHHNDDYV
jgi:hypothetical protein